jgi:hypothetical protein
MICSVLSAHLFRKRFRAIVLLISISVLGAAVIFLTSCSPGVIPVTGKQETAAVSFEDENEESLALLQANINPGKVYRLETNSQGVKVVPPDTLVERGATTFNLGASYRLVISSDSGMIIPPVYASTDNQQVDLGEGFVLAITDGTGHIIPPSTYSSLLPLAHDPNVLVQYIGQGFLLVTDPNGTWVLQNDTQ